MWRIEYLLFFSLSFYAEYCACKRVCGLSFWLSYYRSSFGDVKTNGVKHFFRLRFTCHEWAKETGIKHVKRHRLRVYSGEIQTDSVDWKHFGCILFYYYSFLQLYWIPALLELLEPHSTTRGGQKSKPDSSKLDRKSLEALKEKRTQFAEVISIILQLSLRAPQGKRRRANPETRVIYSLSIQ